MSQTRQLAAILFADIEGFTGLMQRDESYANTLREKLKSVMEDHVLLHGGHIHHWSGDGALCSFNSAVEAVRASIEVQKQMAIAPKVPLRIGVHSGDVLIQENELYGDGVNIASRIESFAVAGGVFMSGKIYDEIRNQSDITTVSLGKFNLKNVSVPIEIFTVSSDGLVVPSRKHLEGKGSVTGSRKSWILPALLVTLLAVTVFIWIRFFNNTSLPVTSIAVLPFVDMSANKDQEYFGDGLSEELLDRLAKIPGLKVIARTSSFSFKGKNVDLRTIGDQLGVTHIIEGSVRKSDNTIRITVQLNNTKDGSHLWSETYDRTLDDIFKVQDEIALAVVKQLKATLLNDKLYDSDKSSPKAYNIILQGRYFSEQGNDESREKAVTLFKEALAIDSGDARGWAALSLAYSKLAGSQYLNKSEGIILARQAAEKAIALQPDLADGYLARGRIKQIYDWDWMGADADYNKAFLLNPNDAAIIHRKASLARTLGRFDEAIPLYRKAIELDPVTAATYNSLAIALVNWNHFDEAKKQFRKVMELNPKYNGCYSILSGIYMVQGKYDSAYAVLEQEPEPIWKMAALPMIYFSTGRIAESDSLLQLLIADYEEDWTFQIAENYAWRGDRDHAFYWLEKAYTNRDSGLVEMKGNPLFRNIESDPRYAVFMKKMGLN
ncbi:MAG: adenylate/guanylate cyclase domain-containing protein [Chitinophagales bacterium]